MGALPLLRSHKDYDGNRLADIDFNTFETMARYYPVLLDEDFVGPGHTFPSSATVGYPWISKTVQTGGTPAVAVVSNAANGVARLSIDSTSEKQEASLYAADVLNWDMTKSAVFECRAAMHVLPSAAAVMMVMGLQSAWIDGPNNASFYAQFEALASGLVNIRTKDGVNTVSNSSAITLVADVMHNFRIDAQDPTNILFFIDGAKVSPLASASYMAFAATGANAILQPYFSVYKASGTGVGTLDVDMVQLGANRS